MVELVALGVKPQNVLGQFQQGQANALGMQRAKQQNAMGELEMMKERMGLIGSVALGAKGGKLDGEVNPDLYEQGLDFLAQQGMDVSQYRGKPQLADIAARGSLSVLQAMNAGADMQTLQLQMAKFQQDMQNSAVENQRREEELGLKRNADQRSAEELELKKQEAANKQSKPEFNDERALSKEFISVTKDYPVIRDAYSKIQATAANPSAGGDMALIFSFMKLLDPGSVVRETEFANAQNAAGVPDQIRNTWNRLMSGERLNQAQRQDFLKQAETIYQSQEKQYKDTRAKYENIAKQYNFDPTRVFADMIMTEDSGFDPQRMNGAPPPAGAPTNIIDVDDLLKKYGG